MTIKRQRLGQHMLVDGKVLAKIISAAEISKNETVCEAGTGLGVLTAELCKRAKNVVSFEVDSGLLQHARQDLHFDNLELVAGDIFKLADLAFDVFVSNLPYSRSRDAIEWLATQKFDRSVVMVQREFAEKLAAAPGDRDYRAISALANYCFKITRVTSVDRKSFSPQPTVESVVLKIVPINTVTRNTIGNLNLLFSKRNKKASSVIAKAGISGINVGEKRIDQLPGAILVEMARMLHDIRAI
ncbi:MAG: 16S rRNA (adenine(1518)-N(6)/adenine(1519)-N(6))-dimethyltransferase RsmA [Nitrososphaera sp.]